MISCNHLKKWINPTNHLLTNIKNTKANSPMLLSEIFNTIQKLNQILFGQRTENQNQSKNSVNSAEILKRLPDNLSDKDKRNIQELLDSAYVLIGNISTKLPDNFNFSDIKNIKESLDSINKNIQIDKNNKININITEITNNITKFIFTMDQINIFIFSLKRFKYNLYIILYKITSIIQEILNDEQNSKNRSYSNSSLFKIIFDSNEKRDSAIVLLLSKPNDQIIKIFDIFIDDCQKAMIENNPIFKNNQRKKSNENNVNLQDYLKKEFNKFLIDIKEIFAPFRSKNCPAKLNLNEAMHKIKSKLEEFKDLLDSDSTKNEGLLAIHNMSVIHSKQAKSTIFYNVSLINSLYGEYIEGDLNEIVLKNFNDLCEGNNLDQIQDQGKYYLFDSLFKIIIQILLNKELFISQYKQYVKSYASIDNKIVISESNIFTNNSEGHHTLCSDVNMNFIIIKSYNSESDSKEISREKRIMSQKISKFIVCLKESESDDNEVIIPYFPNGTIFSLIDSMQEDEYSIPNQSVIQLTIVDKIVIILEIATALNDLYSHNGYHGGLSDQSIFISSSKDAYIGSFFYDRNHDFHCSFLPNQLNFRSPERFKYGVSKAINIKQEQMADIYAFGVLMHEIITEKTPKKRIKIISIDQIMRILKCEHNKYKDYCDFLFKEGGGNEVFEDNYKDDGVISFKGMKEIIEKCMKKETTKRFSSFKEIIDALKALPIYTNNKEEIEFRLIHAIDAREYQCTISDLVESYYRGQTKSKKDIDEFLLKCKKISGQSPKLYSDDPILKIYDSFILLPVKNKTEKCIQILQDIPNKLESRSIPLIMNVIKMIFKQYERKIDKSAVTQAYSDFLELVSQFSIKVESKDKLEEVKHLIYEILEHKKFYYIDFLVRIIEKNLLIKARLLLNFQDIDSTELHSIHDILIFNDLNASYKISFDNEMLFYLEKTYNNNVKEKIIDREKYILSQENSKFIVHYAINGKNKSNKLIIPYFPIGNLDSLLFPQQSSTNSEYQLKLNMIDKIVMIYEVATALNDLHSNDEYHGNLSSQSIYINSSKDAYLGSFCYDQSLETDSTKPRGPFYYRAPENIKSNNNDDKNEHKEEEETEDYINKQQKNDIYSFGVLLHEILTEISSESRFGNSSRQKRLEILKCECNDENKKRKEDDKEKKDENTEIQEKYTDNFKNYCDFLFKEGGGNEVFEDNYKDEEGNSFQGMKEIIEKCMKTETTERYSSFKELIGCIEALPIYTNNKEEIEFRLKHAIDAREYQCTISDLVESYYRGQTRNKEDIESFLSLLQQNSPTKTYLQENDDLIMKIYDSCDQSFIKDIWLKLYSINKYHKPQDNDFMMKSIKYIYEQYEPYIGTLQKKKIFDNFIASLDRNLLSKLTENKNIIENDAIFEEIQSSKKYYLIDFFCHVAFNVILDQNFFVSRFQSESKVNNDSSLFYIRDSSNYVENNSIYRLYFDNKLNFNLEKEHKSQIDQKEIDREKSIMSSSLSKFIVRFNKDCSLIPYYPMGSLYSLVSLPKLNDFNDRIISEFTPVDKIVMILEIATALKDLHSHNEYHGNLSDQSIFIDSTKDAYLGSFFYDRTEEAEASKLRGQIYYRDPENYEIDINEEPYSKLQLADIFSFAVLIHEIITEISPEIRFGNKPREQRLNIFKGNNAAYKSYSDFLFKEGGGNEVFEDNYKDEEGNSFQGMKEIIEKCMKKEMTERYSSFTEIIECIEALPIYNNNKEEIEFRIKHARDAREYQCTISDLFESYYRLQAASKGDIENLFAKICSSLDIKEGIFKQIEDASTKLFEIFNIKCDEDYSQYFEDIFNLVINLSYNKKLSRNQSVVDEEDYLLKLSREANFDEEEGREIVIPVCSLGSFIENNGNRIEEGDSLTFLYFIAKDLSLIHSNNLYHGEVRADHIGLYYNHETRTLIPSVILYYSYYKNNQNSMNDMNSKKRIPSKMYSSEELVSKQQRKDIKNFIKIAEKLGIPPTILSIIQESGTMNEIVYHLYNFIRNNSNEKQLEIFERNYSSCSYSSFVITYPIIEEVFHHIEDKKYSFEGLAIDFENIYQMMNGLLDSIESHPENSIKDNLPPFITSTNMTQAAERIADLIENIKSKCKILYTEINGNNPKEESSLIIDMGMNSVTIRQVKDNNSPEKSIDKQEVQEIVLSDYTGPKKKIYQTKIDNLPSKEVFRYIEFAGLYKRSVGFLLKRYIFNLNPKFRYRITIKLNNQKYLDTQDESITLNEIKRITSQIDRIRKEPEAQDGNIVVLIKAETDKSSDNQQK